MEISREKNVSTYIFFLLVNSAGALVSGATGLDSEIEAWDDGTAPNGFTDCTNEATEVGSSGWYYLLLSQAEMNNDYIAIQIKSNEALTQGILINTKFCPKSSLSDVDGTAQAGAASTITLAATASATDDLYNNLLISLTGGTGAGQTRLITDYVGSTKVATIKPNWTTTPDSTTTYVLVANGIDQMSNIVETNGSITAQQALSIILAAVAGRSSNNGLTFADPSGSNTRIAATVDGNSNRTAITLTPSS